MQRILQHSRFMLYEVFGNTSYAEACRTIKELQTAVAMFNIAKKQAADENEGLLASLREEEGKIKIVLQGVEEKIKEAVHNNANNMVQNINIIGKRREAIIRSASKAQEAHLQDIVYGTPSQRGMFVESGYITPHQKPLFTPELGETARQLVLTTPNTDTEHQTNKRNSEWSEDIQTKKAKIESTATTEIKKEIEGLTVEQLRALAKKKGLTNTSKMKKKDLQTLLSKDLA